MLELAARRGYATVCDGTNASDPGPNRPGLRAIEERQKHAGRHLLAHTATVADSLLAWLRDLAPGVEFVAVGSLRRGVETNVDLDVLERNIAGMQERCRRWGVALRPHTKTHKIAEIAQSVITAAELFK